MRWSFVPAFLVLAGCASSPVRDAGGLSRSEAAALEALSPAATPGLLASLRAEAASRPAEGERSRPPREAVAALVRSARSPGLKADEAFARLTRAVRGDAPDIQGAFADAVAESVSRADSRCRQPLDADYLSRRYGAGERASACPDGLPFLVLSRRDGVKVVRLEPGRVRSIHLLFVGGGRSLASRFGHVALRLVVCPPGRDAKDDCAAELQEHLTLGFLAQVDELSLSARRALTGRYRAYLFARPFMDAYEQYAVNEFRDIYSLPLELDASQRERVLRGLAQIHWQYEGEYRFLGNNCAGMLVRALRVMLPEFAREAGLSEDRVRPDRFFAAARKSAWADGAALADLERAGREGLFFSSARPYYEKALAAVRGARPGWEVRSLDAYLAVAPADRRSGREADAPFMAKLKSDRSLREAELLLEQYAMLSSERRFLREGLGFLQKRGGLDSGKEGSALDADAQRALDACLLAPLRAQFQPLARMGGIPEDPAVPPGLEAPSDCRSEQGLRSLQAAFVGLAGGQRDDWGRLRAIVRYWADTVGNIKGLKEI